MEKPVATLEWGASCCGWNYSGLRFAVGGVDGTVSVYDSGDSNSSVFTSKWKANDNQITSIVWLPPEYGDALACICSDGSASIWEEVGEDAEPIRWKICKNFEKGNFHILDVQFQAFPTNLKMVAAYSDGNVKIFELLDPLELGKWQLQAEFQNVTDQISRFRNPSCCSASIAWKPRVNENRHTTFVLGFNSDLHDLNSPKIWEFEEAHQRWLPLAELALPDDKADAVFSVSWAPNIGRPFEIIAIATSKGIAIWHVGLNISSDGKLPTKRVALLSSRDKEVWQLEWDMGGMTLASTGQDGTVSLWQSNIDGIWHEQAILK